MRPSPWAKHGSCTKSSTWRVSWCHNLKNIRPFRPIHSPLVTDALSPDGPVSNTHSGTNSCVPGRVLTQTLALLLSGHISLRSESLTLRSLSWQGSTSLCTTSEACCEFRLETRALSSHTFTLKSCPSTYQLSASGKESKLSCSLLTCERDDRRN